MEFFVDTRIREYRIGPGRPRRCLWRGKHPWLDQTQVAKPHVGHSTGRRADVTWVGGAHQHYANATQIHLFRYLFR